VVVGGGSSNVAAVGGDGHPAPGGRTGSRYEKFRDRWGSLSKGREEMGALHQAGRADSLGTVGYEAIRGWKEMDTLQQAGR
jgi:hypothetical protein